MKIQVEIPPSFFYNVFVTSFEGGSTHWLNEGNPISPQVRDPDEPRLVWWGHKAFWASNWEIELTYDLDGQETETKKLKLSEVQENLQKVPLDLLAKFLPENEDYDADDADMVVQYLVFGKLVYG